MQRTGANPVVLAARLTQHLCVCAWILKQHVMRCLEPECHDTFAVRRILALITLHTYVSLTPGA